LKYGPESGGCFPNLIFTQIGKEPPPPLPTLLEALSFQICLFRALSTLMFSIYFANQMLNICRLLRFILICVYVGVNWFILQILLNQIAALVLSHFCLAFLKLLISFLFGASIILKLFIPCTF